MAIPLRWAMKTEKYFVAGHNGMVGSAIVRALLAYNVDTTTYIYCHDELANFEVG